MTTPSVLGTGSVFAGDYRLIRPLNQGGMGAVYVVEQISTGKQRALKLMHAQLVSDPELRRRFEQEARIGSRIESEHVVEVHAAGVDEGSGLPYLVMELLEGEDLAARAKRGPMPVQELRAVFEQLCHAMSAAHRVGIVHRDLKPENVFLARSRRAGALPFMVKVLDFGIAKLAAEAGTRDSTGAMGSPLWMAPEQTERGTITPAADVWPMGLIAFALLTGANFWRTATLPDGTIGQLLREIVLEPIPLASERAAERGAAERLPTGFDEWFAKCMAREPHMRFTDAAQAWSALATLVGADPLGATALGTPSSAPDGVVSGPDQARRVLSGPDQAPSAPVPSPVRVHRPPPGSITGATPPPVASASEPASGPTARRVFATAVLAGLLCAGVALAIGGYFVLRARPADRASAASIASVSATPSVVESSAPAVPSASLVVSSAPAEPLANAAVEPTRVAHDAPSVRATAAQAPAAPATAAAAPNTQDELGPNGSMNPHVWKLKSGEHVRLVCGIVKNDSNVADAIVRRAVEWSAWEYNRCYDGAYGQQATGLPTGSVVVGFDILDQLPRHAAVDRSDFKDDAFNACVKGTLVNQTINAAGPNGKGHVVYSFKFVPN